MTTGGGIGSRERPRRVAIPPGIMTTRHPRPDTCTGQSCDPSRDHDDRLPARRAVISIRCCDPSRDHDDRRYCVVLEPVNIVAIPPGIMTTPASPERGTTHQHVAIPPGIMTTRYRHRMRYPTRRCDPSRDHDDHKSCQDATGAECVAIPPGIMTTDAQRRPRPRGTGVAIPPGIMTTTRTQWADACARLLRSLQGS